MHSNLPLEEYRNRNFKEALDTLDLNNEEQCKSFLNTFGLEILKRSNVTNFGNKFIAGYWEDLSVLYEGEGITEVEAKINLLKDYYSN